MTDIFDKRIILSCPKIGRFLVGYKKELFDQIASVIFKYYFNGITDEDELLNFFRTDSDNGLLSTGCHCRGMVFGCADCEDRMFMEGVVIKVIEVLVDGIEVNDDVRDFASGCFANASYWYSELIDENTVMLTIGNEP